MITIVEFKKSGHRKLYIKYFMDLFLNVKLVQRKFDILKPKYLFSSKMFFLTSDDSLLICFFISLFRKIFNKKTILISIRAETIFNKKSNFIKRYIRFLLFKLIKVLRIGKIITILPFFIEKKLESICNSFIFDPAFFVNLLSLEKEKPSTLFKIYNCKICFLGNISCSRNPDAFLQFYREYNDFIKGSAIIAGKNTYFTETELNNIIKSGIIFYPDYIPNHDFINILKNTEIVWCGFQQEYDVFSGLFCLAISYNKKIIVRKKSYLESFLVYYNFKQLKKFSLLNNEYLLYETCNNKFNHLTAKTYNENLLKCL